MADNVPVTPGSGVNVAADDVGGTHHQRVKLSLGADGSATDALGGAGAVAAGVQRVTLASDDPAVTALASLGATVLDAAATVTRPSNTTAYTAGDALSNSTSAPTSGGFTLSNAAAASGEGGIITDAVIVSSNAPATPLRGEIWLFDGAATNINDNDAFALSDADALLCLGKIPFALTVEAGNNSHAHVKGLNIGYHCVGSANLRFLVRVLHAYIPASGETLTVRIKGVRA